MMKRMIAVPPLLSFLPHPPPLPPQKTTPSASVSLPSMVLWITAAPVLSRVWQKPDWSRVTI